MKKIKTGISEELINQILKLYKQGIPIQKVADILQLNSKTVSKYLDIHGIPKRDKNIITEDKGIEIINKYIHKNMSMNNIAKEYNINSETIRQYFIKKGIPRKLKNGRYNYLNDTINLSLTKELAYVLGVLEGDGTIEKLGNDNTLRLEAKDKDFVEYLKYNLEKLGFENIHVRHNIFDNPKWNDTYILSVTSKKFCEFYWGLDIERYVHYNDYIKLLTTSEMKAKFVQGMFDSEGSVYHKPNTEKNTYKNNINITNTDKPLLELINIFLLDLKIWNKLSSYVIIKGKYKPLYRLNINPICANLFLTRVGTSIKRKKDTLQNIASNGRIMPLSYLEIDAIIYDYIQGMPIYKLCKKYHRKNTIIKRILLEKRNCNEM